MRVAAVEKGTDRLARPVFPAASLELGEKDGVDAVVPMHPEGEQRLLAPPWGLRP